MRRLCYSEPVVVAFLSKALFYPCFRSPREGAARDSSRIGASRCVNRCESSKRAGTAATSSQLRRHMCSAM